MANDEAAAVRLGTVQSNDSRPIYLPQAMAPAVQTYGTTTPFQHWE